MRCSRAMSDMAEAIKGLGPGKGAEGEWDLKQIIAPRRCSPSADLKRGVQKAEQAISGTADTAEGVQSTARRLGIDPNIANSLYARYGKTMRKAPQWPSGDHTRRPCA